MRMIDMANEQNLQTDKYKIKTSEEAQKRGRNGGKSRSLAKKLSKRKYCNSTCPIYDRCWAKHTAQSIAKKQEEDNKKKGIIEIIKAPCAIKNLPSRVIERTMRLINDGEDGFIQEILDTMIRLGSDLDIQNDSNAKERYLYQLRENLKSIFGSKSKFEGKVESESLTASHFAQAYQEHLKEQEEKENDRTEKSESK